MYSGYLFTRETLRRIVEIGLNQNLCSTFNIPGGGDDIILGNLNHIKSKSVIIKFTYSGRCLDIVNVTFVDDRDQDGRHRFIHYAVDKLFDEDSMEMRYIRKHDHYPHGPVCWVKIIVPSFNFKFQLKNRDLTAVPLKP